MSLQPVPQFTAPSYGDRTNNEIQSCINLYPEKTVNGYQLISTPGLGLWGTATNNQACRGAYYSSTGKLFSAHADTIYEWTSAGVPTSRGTLSGWIGGTDPLYFADNGTQLFIVDAGGSSGAGYTLVMTAGVVTIVADVNYPLSSMVTFQDGYFIVSKIGTGEFYLSKLYDGTSWTPIQFATAESKGDPLVGVFSNGSNLYLIGTKTIEIWYNTGNSSFPFQRINGTTIQFGTVIGTRIGNLNGVLYFLGSSVGGKGTVWSLAGTTPQQISSAYIGSLFENEQQVPSGSAKLIGFCYSIDGHSFFQMNGINTQRTFVFDINETSWFQKQSLISAQYLNDRIFTCLNAFEINSASSNVTKCIAFDNYDGRAYTVGTKVSGGGGGNYNSEDGTAIKRTRIFGPIESNTKKLFHYQIRIEADVQMDNQGASTVSASLDWTDNNGQSYSTALTLTASIVNTSQIGQRILWVANRLGSSPSRYYRLTLTGPAAKIILKKCELDAKEGRF